LSSFLLGGGHSASAQIWLLKRVSPVAVGLAVKATALVAAHEIRDTLPQAIATYGSSGSGLLIEQVRKHLQAHKIVGPNAAIDTAARVVKAHPELMANAAAVVGVLALPMAAFEQRLAETRKDEAVAADQADDREQKKCPDAQPARQGNPRPAPRAYQQQITGINPDLAFFIDGREFDGCREADGTLLEAKGVNYAKFIHADLSGTQIWYQGEEATVDQAERQAQIAIAHNWKLEWHFAEKLASEYYALVFAGLPNAKMIKVLFDPPLQKP
jgi:hypothetical protein